MRPSRCLATTALARGGRCATNTVRGFLREDDGREARQLLSKLIEEACSGEDVVIARGAKPVVRLVPVNAAQGERKPGRLKGQLHVGPEFFEPLPPEELDRWE